jgi:hypothetical protein
MMNNDAMEGKKIRANTGWTPTLYVSSYQTMNRWNSFVGHPVLFIMKGCTIILPPKQSCEKLHEWLLIRRGFLDTVLP